MKPILATLLLLISLYSFSVERKSVFERKRMKECWEIICKLEKGLMGAKDLAKAEKLLRKATGTERAWLAACIGQYHRDLRNEPVDGIKALVNECLGTDKAKNWVKQLRDAENKRMAEWRKQASDARRKREEAPAKPTGLAVKLPSMNVFKVTTQNAPAALELSRCLAQLGEVSQAIAVIDKCGSTLQDDKVCLMLSYEALADLNRMNHDYSRVASGYGTALKVFGALKKRRKEYGDGFSKWEKASESRIKRKLAEVKKLIEAEKYGKGWVDYRDAEVVRRKNKDYVKALLMYDKIIEEHAETVYEAAARSYSIKCLLELSKKKRPPAGSDKKLTALMKQLTEQEAVYKLAKRAKVPENGMLNIQNNIETIKLKIRRAKAVPYGTDALAEAKARAAEATKTVWGLYVGEILFDLGNHELIQSGNIESSRKYFSQGNRWVSTVNSANRTLASYQLPGKAKSVATPPKKERKCDKWGNNELQKISIGAVINRFTADWYLPRLKTSFLLHIGLLDYAAEDYKNAEVHWKQTRKLDDYVVESEKLGFGSVVERLMWNIRNNAGGLYATKAEMKEIRKEKKLVIPVLLADLHYENEEHDKAMQLYGRIKKGEWGRLSNNQSAYVDFALCNCYNFLSRNDKKYPGKMKVILTGFEKRYPNAPTTPRAIMMRANLRTMAPGRNRRKTEGGFKDYKLLIEEYGNTQYARKAMFIYAHKLMSLAEYDEAEKLFKCYIKKYPNEEGSKGCEFFLKRIEKLKETRSPSNEPK